MIKYILFILLTCSSLSAQLVNRVSRMPDQPEPYEMRDWKKVAAGYDSLVFDLNITGEYLPLCQIFNNTVNYPDHPSFGLQTVVGSVFPQSSEAINCIPAVIGATLIGIDKSNQNGHNWVLGCEEFFNKRSGENIYLNHPVSTSGDDWWYETMPNLFFYQLYDLYPAIGDFKRQFTIVADQWTRAITGLGGATTPWKLPDMNARAWSFSEMKPLKSGVPEPEAAGAIAWLLYHAWVKTGNKLYRIAAEQAMEFLDRRSENPSYELQLAYGVYIAARMNAELYTGYDLEKLVNWCFDKGPLRDWGVISGNWGGYDVHGLVGEISANHYAFLMNGFQQAAALVPMVRYDERFAPDIAKWILNLANASRLFFSQYLPANKQDSDEWAFQYDPEAYIGYEALRQNQWGSSPYATGDAISGGWGKTNLALYGSSHVGYLAALIDTTTVKKILKIDVCKTDFFQHAFPTWLYYNPYEEQKEIQLLLPNTCDGWDLISNRYVFRSLSGHQLLSLGAKQTILLTLIPVGTDIYYHQDQMSAGNQVIDYHSGVFDGNYPPRIKSLAAGNYQVNSGQAVRLYCTAVDPDGDKLSCLWLNSAQQVIGEEMIIDYLPPELNGEMTLVCRVQDIAGHWVEDSVKIKVISNQAPFIEDIKVNKSEIEPGDELGFSCHAVDAEMDTLTYQWQSDAGQCLGTGKDISWRAPDSPGYYEVRCIVSDAFSADTATAALFVGSLVAFYPFDGNAADMSGYDNDGIIKGATLVPDRFAVQASALRFADTDDVVQIANHPSLNFRRTISINLWMKMDKITRESYVLSHGSWQNRLKLSILPDRRLRWTIKTTSGVMDLDSRNALDVDSLYNVCVTFGAGSASIFLNGRLNSRKRWDGFLETTRIDLVIGQMLPANSEYGFYGLIDDVRIYNALLTESEIAALYDLKTGIGEYAQVLPKETGLATPYPNPFNQSTEIGYNLSTESRIEISVYNVLGQKIRKLLDCRQNPGRYALPWNGDDDLGMSLPSGLYFLIMKTDGLIESSKITILR